LFQSKKRKDEDKRAVHIRDLLNEFMDKHKELKEFEEELEKHKEEITPGQVGES
jgi:hypothetical protein